MLRELSLNKGFTGKKATCQVCGNVEFTSVMTSADSHNDHCFICGDCYQNGVVSTSGMFVPKVFIERQAKKDAKHGCRVWWEVTESDEKKRAELIAMYPTFRAVNTYVSTSKIGTWQLSKVADNYKNVVAHVTKDGYNLDGTPTEIINAVREISSNHNTLTPSIITKYGFKKMR